ncbi:MAG: PH domain-containing protein [Miniphocaeibacter sp.]|uniref:PH domain-containing protein n=1 Tax=Miniphocaeibacter sp. TaxID=3100973 RepID=UPI00182C225A|nr:hypothetical protein [Gallicola sp.]
MIMLFFIMNLTLMPLVFLMYYWNKKTLKYSNGEIFLVKIPYSEKDNKEILEISKKSLKLLKILSLLSVILILLGSYILIYKVHSFMFVLVVILLIQLLIDIYLNAQRKKVLTMKIENNWQFPTDVFIDTKLINSDLKSKYNLVLYSSLFVFIISVTIFIFVQNLSELAFFILFSSINILIFTLIMKSENYNYISEDFEENYEYNLEKIKANKRILSQFVVINILTAGISIFINLILKEKNSLILNTVLISMIINIIAIFIFFIRYSKLNKKYYIGKNNINTTGDFYDYFGYNNPYDNRIFVEKKVSIGMTINTGTLKGKIAVLLTFILIFFAMFATGTRDYNYDLNNSYLKVSSNLYSDEIKLRDIENIEFKEIKEFPKGYRSNGVGTAKQNYGSFKYEGWGNVRLYSYNDNSFYILVDTSSKKYIFNEKTKKETEELFNSIREKLE